MTDYLHMSSCRQPVARPGRGRGAMPEAEPRRLGVQPAAQERIIFLGSEVDDQVANRICAQMLLLAAEDEERDIWLLINSPGGSVYSGMAIYDIMQFVTNDVATVAMGMAASMGQLAARAPARRASAWRCRTRGIMMHQPSGGIGGTAVGHRDPGRADALHQADVPGAGRVPTRPEPGEDRADSDRDRWFTAEGGADYGFIDSRITGPSRPEGAEPWLRAKR